MSPATEHLDVLVIGAGLSGIGAAHHLQAKCPWATYAIVEARDTIGGTWDLFRYPGVRSDSDMYTLGYSFRPWTGPQTIADGPSILRYLQETAAEAGIDRRIRFRHRVVAASWSTERACWHVTAERTDTGETVELTAGFVVSCTGYYRYDHGHQPELPGLDRFAGPVVHPQHWPDDLDVTGRRVVVIGSGATAVTLVPALAAQAAHVTMLQRSPTYVAAVPRRSPVAAALARVLPPRLAGPAIRWALALSTQGFYRLSRWRPDLVRRLLRRGAIRHLPDGFDVDTHFNPRYDPWDQRLCAAPDGDLFRAISAGTASVVTDEVARIDERGIDLASGNRLDLDVIVTATGLELLFLGGIELDVDGEPVHVPDRLTYKGMMLEGVPNLAIAVGYTNASWTLKCELTCDYVTRLLNHLRDHGLRQCTPGRAGPSVERRPLLGLTSGYIRRAAHRFPTQGSASPWRLEQSYLADFRAMKLRGINDGVMVFSNPASAVPPAAEADDIVAAVGS